MLCPRSLHKVGRGGNSQLGSHTNRAVSSLTAVYWGVVGGEGSKNVSSSQNVKQAKSSSKQSELKSMLNPMTGKDIPKCPHKHNLSLTYTFVEHQLLYFSVNQSVRRFVRFRSQAIHTNLMFSHINDTQKPLSFFQNQSDYVSIRVQNQQIQRSSFHHKLLVTLIIISNILIIILIPIINIIKILMTKVTAGNFLPTSKNCGEFLAYAVGAPRANGTGQVVLFVKCHSELLKVSSLSCIIFFNIIHVTSAKLISMSFLKMTFALIVVLITTVTLLS